MYDILMGVRFDEIIDRYQVDTSCPWLGWGSGGSVLDKEVVDLLVSWSLTSCPLCDESSEVGTQLGGVKGEVFPGRWAGGRSVSSVLSGRWQST